MSEITPNSFLKSCWVWQKRGNFPRVLSVDCKKSVLRRESIVFATQKKSRIYELARNDSHRGRTAICELCSLYIVRSFVHKVTCARSLDASIKFDGSLKVIRSQVNNSIAKRYHLLSLKIIIMDTGKVIRKSIRASLISRRPRGFFPSH